MRSISSSSVRRRTMQRASLRLTLLSLAVAIVMSGLPSPANASAASAAPQRPAAQRPAAPRPALRRRSGRVPTVVPLGTNLRVRLNDDLSSKDSRVADRFTATVVNPSRYEGATLRGHIRSIRKSGTVNGHTTMTLAFDSIELREGRGGALHGQVARIYD